MFLKEIPYLKNFQKISDKISEIWRNFSVYYKIRSLAEMKWHRSTYHHQLAHEIYKYIRFNYQISRKLS